MGKLRETSKAFELVTVNIEAPGNEKWKARCVQESDAIVGKRILYLEDHVVDGYTYICLYNLRKTFLGDHVWDVYECFHCGRV